MPLDAEFTFHPVGQGLFYSGKIRNDNKKDFDFVYDCGSRYKSSMQHCVRKYIDILDNNTIDMFIISHLHYDHINGFLELLNKNIFIKNIILPYITPLQRLSIALENLSRPTDFYNFLSNPVNYIISIYEKNNYKDYKIIFVETNGITEKDNEEDLKLESDFELKFWKNNNNLKNIIKDNNDFEINKSSKFLEFKSIQGPIFINKKFELRFYQRFIDKTSNTMKTFQQKVTAIIGNKDIKAVIKSSKKRSKLKKAYLKLSKQLENNINNTSLVVYSIPYQSNNKVRNNSVAQMLTGDISLKDNNVLTEIESHFTLDRLCKVFVFQIPHHGSEKNWNKKIFNKFKNAKYFVASNDNKSYGHPSPIVVSQINATCNYYVNPYDSACKLTFGIGYNQNKRNRMYCFDFYHYRRRIFNNCI